MSMLRRIFNRKPKSYLLHDKYEIVPAFQWQGQTYYMHKDPLNTLAGRGLTSLVFMEELIMRCDVSYLRDHCKAVTAALSGGKGSIDLTTVVRLNANLAERVELLAAIPGHVYKLASVVFFTKDESPFLYDHARGMEKVRAWQAMPDMYAFFLTTPLKDLIPFLALPEQNSATYLETLGKIDTIHVKTLREALSRKASKPATKK